MILTKNFSQAQSRAPSPVAHPIKTATIPLPVLVLKCGFSSLNPFKAFSSPLLLVQTDSAFFALCTAWKVQENQTDKQLLFHELHKLTINKHIHLLGLSVSAIRDRYC